MPFATLATADAALAIWSVTPKAESLPPRRARAFLLALARQPLPVVLFDPDEVRMGCDLARQGYVQAGRGGSGDAPALVVCGITPWGRRSMARAK